MAQPAMPFGLEVETTRLAAQLSASQDPAAFELAADEEEAAARFGDQLAKRHFAAGCFEEGYAEQAKNVKSRARARQFRAMAARLRVRKSA